MAFWPPFGAGIFTRPRTSLRRSKESWAVGRGRRSSIWPNRGYARIRDRPDSSPGPSDTSPDTSRNTPRLWADHQMARYCGLTVAAVLLSRPPIRTPNRRVRLRRFFDGVRLEVGSIEKGFAWNERLTVASRRSRWRAIRPFGAR